jgi:hypothetical protein
MVSPNVKECELHDQLLADIDHYRCHPDCANIFFFIYDPGGLLKNPHGIERDLHSDGPGVRVRVRVYPKL